IPYWENLFPAAAGNLGFGPPGGTPSKNNLGCAPGGNFNSTTYTATQAMYDMYSCFPGNETTGLFVAIYSVSRHVQRFQVRVRPHLSRSLIPSGHLCTRGGAS